MSEMIAAESDAGEDRASAAPGKPVSELGQGFNDPDTPLGVPERASEQPEGTEPSAESDTTPETTNEGGNGAPTDDERRAAGLRQADYTRKTQEVAAQRRQLEADRAELTRQRAELDAERARTGPSAPAASPVGGLRQQIDQAMADPNLGPADRMGLNVLGNLTQTLDAQAQTIAELRQKLEKFEPQFEATTNTLRQMTQEQNAARVRQIQQELDESYALFGEEATQGSSEFLRRNLGMTNPGTGKPFSVSELVALATGRSLQEASQARQLQRDKKGRIKSAVRPGGTHADTASVGGTISRSEALRQIRERMA